MKKAVSQKPGKSSNQYLEKNVLDSFVKPVALWTYDGGVLVKEKLSVMKYELRIDGKIRKKLDVLFAFPREDYDAIKQGISVNKQIETEQHKPIEKREERPAVVSSEREYIRGTGKDVQITLRTGHVLSGHQVYSTMYNIILRINDKIVLIYKHGILEYEKPDSKSEETQDG